MIEKIKHFFRKDEKYPVAVKRWKAEVSTTRNVSKINRIGSVAPKRLMAEREINPKTVYEQNCANFLSLHTMIEARKKELLCLREWKQNCPPQDPRYAKSWKHLNEKE